jgi:DNA-binding IclR family transcriptional regulator
MEQQSSIEAGSAQLERGLSILEFLTRSGSPRALSEIAGQVGGPKATVHRLLSTLLTRGYVTQDRRTALYSAGVRCFELGSLWARNLDLRSQAGPYLAQLNETTGEIVHLAVYDHGEVVYVEKLESRHDVVPKSFVGRRCPATCVATGRALLAFQPAEEIDDVLSRPLPAYTASSPTDPQEVRDLLSQVRARGWAENRGTYRDEVGGLAAPIRDHTGRVIAAVGVCLPLQRFGKSSVPALRDATVDTAVRISAALGGPDSLLTSPGQTDLQELQTLTVDRQPGSVAGPTSTTQE